MKEVAWCRSSMASNLWSSSCGFGSESGHLKFLLLGWV